MTGKLAGKNTLVTGATSGIGEAIAPAMAAEGEAIADHLAGLVANIPSRRLSTTAEVAAALVFPASDDASDIHGSTLSVDGGYIIV
jgi:NAD(P)-dependent dehydrogenase (short-subunit alcohol dehydrogenase family)